MATTREKVRRAGPASKSVGADLDRALKEFLRAIPFGHLDRRLTALEHWCTRVEMELRRSGVLVGKAAADTARVAVMGPRPAAKPSTRRAAAARRAH